VPERIFVGVEGEQVLDRGDVVALEALEDREAHRQSCVGQHDCVDRELRPYCVLFDLPRQRFSSTLAFSREGRPRD